MMVEDRHEEIKEEDSQLQAKETALKSNQTADTLITNF